MNIINSQRVQKFILALISFKSEHYLNLISEKKDILSAKLSSIATSFEKSRSLLHVSSKSLLFYESSFYIHVHTRVLKRV